MAGKRRATRRTTKRAAPSKGQALVTRGPFGTAEVTYFDGRGREKSRKRYMTRSKAMTDARGKGFRVVT